MAMRRRRRRRSYIAKITKAYVRTYSDNGQSKAYVEWVDTNGEHGRTEGEAVMQGGRLVPERTHMTALFARARREGVRVRRETW